MSPRLAVVAALFALSTSTAFAATSGSDYAAADSSGSGFSFGGATGLLAAGGAAGLAAGLAEAFGNHSSGAQVTIVPSAISAPEISGSGGAAGCALMLGGAFVARGRRRKQ